MLLIALQKETLKRKCLVNSINNKISSEYLSTEVAIKRKRHESFVNYKLFTSSSEVRILKCFWKKLHAGLPQASVLEPVLFLSVYEI